MTFYMAGLGSMLVLCHNPSAAAEKAGALQIFSAGVQSGQSIPAKYTCDGANISPPLTWSGVPANAKSLAIICEDPDAPGGTFTHWVVYGIPAAERQLVEGAAKATGLLHGGK